MRGREFLDAADRLAVGPAEADWRSAVSRAYYAVFHHLRSLLQANGLDIGRGGESHFNLYAGLLNCGDAAVAAVAGRLDSLRDERVRADYHLDQPYDRATARTEIQNARSILADFATASAASSPAQVAAAAKRYLQSVGRIP